MNYPDKVLQITAKMAAEYGDDIPAAVAAAVRTVRGLPGYRSMVDTLVQQCIKELIYQARHNANVAARREEGYYGQPGKVSGVTTTTEEVHRSLYCYYIGGTMLGLVTGSELPVLAAKEELTASGHLFNARLCRKLATLVPDDKRVQDVVSEKKLRTLFRQAQEGNTKAAG